jgi:DNA polymerase-3 subunit beta
MKVTVNSTELSYAVLATSKAAEKDGGISIIAGDDKLTFVTGNGILSIESTVKAEVAEGGKITAPAKILAGTVGKITSEELALEVGEGDKQLSLKYDRGNLKIAILEDKDYSSYIKEQERSAAFEIQIAEFKKIVDSLTRYAATDTSRPILNGVNIASSGDLIVATSCDGYRLATRTIAIKREDEKQSDFNITIPTSALQTIYSLLDKKLESVHISLLNNNRVLEFKQDGLTITSQLLSGDYINVARIIPTQSNINTTLDKDELIKVLDRASVLDNNMVCFDVDENVVTVTNNSDSGNLCETINAKSDNGKKVTIAFNLKWLTEVIKGCDNKAITMSFVGPVAPMVIREEMQLFLILPIRINR